MRLKVPLQDVQHFQEDRISKRIVDLRTLLAADDDVPIAKHGEMLRKIGRFGIESVGQFARADLAFAQFVHDSDPGRMGQGSEHVRLELAQWRVHTTVT